MIQFSSPPTKGATSVVGAGGDFPFTEAGLAAAIALGGKIFVRGNPGGTLAVVTGFTFPDKATFLEFDPSITITAAAAITLFTVPNGLTAKRNYVIKGGAITGGDVANQTVVNQADANARGTIYFEEVTITGFRRVVYQSTGKAGGVQNEVVRAVFERCKVVPPSDAAVLMQAAAVAGTYGYPASVIFKDTALWSEIAPGQKGWTVDYDGDMICEGYVSGTLKGTNRVNGLNTSGPVFALNGATADGTDSLECLGVAYDSGDEIGNAYLDNMILKLSANSFLLDHCGLSSRSKIILNGDGIPVISPRMFYSLADPDYRIDVLAGADNCEVIGGRLEGASTAIIRTSASGLRVTGTSFNATAVPTILEAGAADSTRIESCAGLGTGTGMTLIGASTRVDGVEAGKSTGAGSVAHGWGRLTSVHVQVGNVGGGTDDLQTYALPANALDLAGRTIRVKAWGRTANNANAKTVTLNFGGQVIMTQALTTGIAGTWRIDAEIIKTGASTQDIFAELLQLTTIIHKQTLTAGTQTDTAAITIKCTGAATADNDIIQDGLIVEIS